MYHNHLKVERFDLRHMQALFQSKIFYPILLILVLGTCYFMFLGSRPLVTPDEGRYAEIPREMLATGHYITPHLNHIKYFEKPPLFYWMQAASIKTFGMSEWSVRLVSLLMGLLGCLATYLFAAKIFDKLTGTLSFFVLGSSLLYYIMAHTAILDMTVSCFITFTLYFFLLGANASTRLKQNSFYYLTALSSGLAVMSKGLIGLVLPMSIIGIWMLYLNKWSILKKFPWLISSILFFAVALPWHLLVQMRNPEFFHYYFIVQHFERYLTSSAGRSEPFWFFVPVILLGFFPWSFFLFFVIKKQLSTVRAKQKNHETISFMMIWSIIVLLFFSASQSKLVPYILPILPPLSILTGKYLTDAIQHNRLFLEKMIAGLIILLVCIGIFGINFLWLHHV